MAGLLAVAYKAYGKPYYVKKDSKVFYVYILKSLSFPEQTYVGYTIDLNKRLMEHNNGESLHTSKYRPWEVVVYLVFKYEDKAIAFERYLKSGSGVVFKNNRLL